VKQETDSDNSVTDNMSASCLFVKT